MEETEYFDAWCCAKGVDPLDLPAYRYYNLSLMCLRERNPETLEKSLALMDEIQHPWLGGKKPVATGNTSRPVESKKGLSEDELRGITGLTKSATGGLVQKEMPSWWRGEEANYKIAASVAGQAQSLKSK